MANKLNLETHSVEDLQNEAAALVKQVAKTKKPIRIKAKGQAPVVLVDEDAFEWYINLVNLNRLLNEGMEDIRAGRTRPLGEFLREFACKSFVSSPRLA